MAMLNNQMVTINNQLQLDIWQMESLTFPDGITKNYGPGWWKNWLVVDLPLWKMMEFKSVMMILPNWMESHNHYNPFHGSSHHQPENMEFFQMESPGLCWHRPGILDSASQTSGDGGWSVQQWK